MSLMAPGEFAVYVLIIVPLLLLLIYTLVRVGAAAYFRSKSDFLRRMFYGGSDSQKNSRPDRSGE